MRVTQKQLAEKLGLSSSTVAFALSDSSYARKHLRSETRARVRAVAKEAGYCPNRLASGLRSCKTNTIGLAIRTMEHPHQAYINERIVRLLEAQQFKVLVTVVPELVTTEQIAELVGSHRPEGLIVGPLYHDAAHPLFAQLVRDHFPLVGYHGGSDFPGDLVSHDFYQILELGIAHLKQLGHHRIDHVVAFATDAAWFRERTDGGQTHAFFGTVENGRSFAQQVRVGAGAPTAYWLEDPLFALGFLRGLRQRGVRVPEDVAFVTCPIGGLGAYLDLSLTTVFPDLNEVAQRIVGLMLQRVRGELPPERQEIFLPPRLIVGETTVKPTATGR